MVPRKLLDLIAQQSTEQGSKSTILRPLQWTASICVFALLGAAKYNASQWILISLAVLVFVVVGCLLFAFFYCLTSDKSGLRDALRTEHYSIQLRAIEMAMATKDIPEISVTPAITEPSPPNLIEAAEGTE